MFRAPGGPNIVFVRDVANLDFRAKNELFKVFDQRRYMRRVFCVRIRDGRTRVVLQDVPVRIWVAVDERVMENSTLDECKQKPLRLEGDENEERRKVILACAWRIAVKKCPVGGFGTVAARIPFSQSVAWGPTIEMSPLLGSRVVDGPALTRDAMAGGNFGI